MIQMMALDYVKLWAVESHPSDSRAINADQSTELLLQLRAGSSACAV